MTEKAGLQGKFYGQGVAIGDYDNDGRPDIYVTDFGHNTLYHNNGDGTFTDVTEKAGVGASGWSAGAAFVDYDRDGRLDLFVTRYLARDFEPDIWCGATGPGMRSYCHPENNQAVSSLLFHNNGDSTFADVTEKSGLAKAPGKGLGVDINDYDHDGWPDIFVANDAIAEQLFHNNHDGTFTGSVSRPVLPMTRMVVISPGWALASTTMITMAGRMSSSETSRTRCMLSSTTQRPCSNTSPIPRAWPGLR